MLNVTYTNPRAPWSPKPKNWRKRYGYRAAGIEPLRACEIKAQESAYIAWLAARRGLELGEAEGYARGQVIGAVISAEGADGIGRVRVEEWIGTVLIRTVKPAGSRMHYNGDRPEDADFRWRDWERSSTAATPYYAVIKGGAMVSSFLSKTRAREFAHKIAA